MRSCWIVGCTGIDVSKGDKDVFVNWGWAWKGVGIVRTDALRPLMLSQA
jgi:hypothetical protein